MPRYLDINFGVAHDKDLLPVIERYRTSYEYVKHLPGNVQTEVITHLQHSSGLVYDGISFKGFRAGKRIFQIPFQTLKYIREYKPDVVLIQGLVFPVQTLALKLFAGKNCRLIAQHHGESPYKNKILLRLQKLADKCIDRYLFTSIGNAVQWVEQGVISGLEKCTEVPEASTYLSLQQKEESLRITGIRPGRNFLWVGRLIPGKDPFTVLKAFERYVAVAPDAHLYMIFQNDDLLADVKSFIASGSVLQKHIHLVGKVPHEQLSYWYSAADFYISASHKEGSGYALIEAMACGCIPVVSDIPPFMSLTNNGKAGFHFRKGDAEDMYKVLCSLDSIDKEAFSRQALIHFQANLSFTSIAAKIAAVINRLTRA